ncbi:Molybdopterin molybdenumtransferase [Roseobacter fucihabitans]|uniref:Molybdopterin molybdenumtransferase n=1 Tax=Roseobacter fucihabitans TaxID=1537242 RepID=A0ABZ2BS32_9RHOB|nr:gephyrin-like molybdotransferase Glp [Roseobacter litoralis]MBC6965607.1 Molybdopterin molybdenumtransferase [Roseobacter litoralis]
MIPVAEALEHLFSLVTPLEVESVPLRQAAGRVLARDAVATRTQPPFDASSMDGYALRRSEMEPDAMFKVVGEAAAGHGFSGRIGPGQCVRIFTGAPIPQDVDFVVIQEDVTRRGDLITLNREIGDKDNIRPAGGDFKRGDVIKAPRRLGAPDVALLAAMNIAIVPVTRRPIVAIMATGDELVMPGEVPGADQIIASNTFGLAAQLEAIGAETRMIPIARDTPAALKTAFALTGGADLIITIGGASVGDHDLVAPVAAELGMEQSFYKVAMRPGKPLMAGRLKGAAMIGLPGNPVSALVCGTVFVAPLVCAMLGLPARAMARLQTQLAAPLPANGPREHYMRASVDPEGLRAFDRQDSSLLTVLAHSNALLVRPPHDPARAVGDTVSYLAL